MEGGREEERCLAAHLTDKRCCWGWARVRGAVGTSNLFLIKKNSISNEVEHVDLLRVLASIGQRRQRLQLRDGCTALIIAANQGRFESWASVSKPVVAALSYTPTALQNPLSLFSSLQRRLPHWSSRIKPRHCTLLWPLLPSARARHCVCRRLFFLDFFYSVEIFLIQEA